MQSSGKFHKQGRLNKLSGQHTIDECNHRLHGQYIHHIPSRATDGKEKVKIYDADGKREYIVPTREPVDVPAILPQSEYQRLKKQAHVVTLKDRMRLIEEAEQQKIQLRMESMARREALAKSQKVQKAVPGSKLDSVESEAADKNLYLLQRSKELLTEQDDRVKVANGVILATKCRAIRNAQIEEKKLIEKQLLEENKRLDMMMEQQRQKLIEIEEKKREIDKKKIQRYVSEVKQQIKENEMEQLMAAEKVEEESRMLNKALIELQKEEEQKDRAKKELQHKMRAEFKQANAEAQHYRNVKEEEQRIADLRVRLNNIFCVQIEYSLVFVKIQQFMKAKAEREEARERELALAKAAKEEEIARLRAEQEKSQDQQAAMDEMNALRTQEEKEREWREKEKAAAKKRNESLEDLRAARSKQIEDIRKAQALALVRDEEDFMKVAKVQRELFDKDVENHKKKRQAIVTYRNELLRQINEKERERIMDQQEKYEDGNAQRLEVEINDRYVEDYLAQKVEKLKYSNVADNYVKDIERQLKIKK
ncbi:hypothetical protein NQ314_012277 [Rhamnusium bicolor]|uniref:Cilia- and flagella-associated protein 45 n=1 Tax=Rhamnusium bicolor TaxID=1586634 RepID=A0AAV8XD51_9CUCU|nr:hypothetical protein NQ314_012277 [Rhamnusium bicolor]